MLVVGDVMLDQYTVGCVDKVSQEAPVPILKVTGNRFKLGGAGNVAENLADLGAAVCLCGVVGQDSAAEKIISLCREKSIDVKYLMSDSDGKTTVKQRCVSNNHQLLRIDSEMMSASPILPVKSFDLVIVSDYNKGVVIPELMHKIRELFKGIPVVIDPHLGRSNAEMIECFKNVSLIKPNLFDAQKIAGWNYDSEDDLHSILHSLNKTFNSQVVITLGSKGMALFSDGQVNVIPTQAREVCDVTGAGDTTTAVLGLSLACGASLYEAAILANKAAGLVVEKFGTATVTSNELLGTVCKQSKVKSTNELVGIVRELKRQDKKVVFTNGCFDVLHKMHGQLLQKSKEQGDVLVVALNTDASIKKLKGADRPRCKQDDRAELLSGFECVDFITFFGTKTPLGIIKKLKPDVITKGGDYTDATVCGSKFVKQNGGRVVIIPYIEGYSSTKIINKKR